MTDERFNELLNGPLGHPLIPFRITRLVLALRAVLDACGPQADIALEDYCTDRDRMDSDDGIEVLQ